jgi:hypothetical protein
MTEMTPRRHRRGLSRWSTLITTSNRGYAEVILDGLVKGTVEYNIVLPKQDWFIRTRRINTSDYAILRNCKFLSYDRLTKTFSIRDPLVIGYLAKNGCKPHVVRV